jgi:hypothetical protein
VSLEEIQHGAQGIVDNLCIRIEQQYILSLALTYAQVVASGIPKVLFAGVQTYIGVFLSYHVYAAV